MTEKLSPEESLLLAAKALVEDRDKKNQELEKLREVNNQAKAVLEGKQIVASAPKPEKRKIPKVNVVAIACWCLLLGGIVGATLIPHNSDKPTLEKDYAECISKARYEHPIKNNQYQELVNALYTCGVYKQGG